MDELAKRREAALRKRGVEIPEVSKTPELFSKISEILDGVREILILLKEKEALPKNVEFRVTERDAGGKVKSFEVKS